jgi:hypothetical protein
MESFVEIVFLLIVDFPFLLRLKSSEPLFGVYAGFYDSVLIPLSDALNNEEASSTRNESL